MWSDVLTKPKQGKGFKQDRAILMNIEEDYDDEKERLKTHPSLLASASNEADASSLAMKTGSYQDPMHHCRSVLDGDNRDSVQSRMVTWHKGYNRVDTGDRKARTRHLELVMARITRSWARSNNTLSKGLE